MKQTTYSCPFCQKKDKPTEQISLSLYKCPICKEVFPQKDLKGHEINKIDYAAFWREEKKNRAEFSPLRCLVDGIENIIERKDVDSQMDSMVQESTDNLLHEIIMVRIYNKKPKKTEDKAIKTEIDKIFDIILGKA